METLYSTIKSLADPNRLRIVSALDGRELCACQLVELIEISGAAISQHMNLLIQGNICMSEKRGKWTYYRLIKSPILSIILKEFSKTSSFQSDKEKLDLILSMDPQNLCEIQKSRKRVL
ncbi:MAG: ArsR/SmtB family transcription factor [Brevinema sp.]